MPTINYSGAPNPVYQGLFADFVRALNYPGLDIAKPVPIDGLSGTYPLAVRSVYDRSMTATSYDPDASQALMSGTLPASHSISSASVTLDYYGNHHDLPRVSNFEALGIDKQGFAIRNLAATAVDRHASVLGAFIGATGSYDSSYRADQADITTTTTAVLDNILTGVDAVLDWANGAIMPSDIAVVANPTVTKWLAQNDDFTKSVAANAQDQRITRSQVGAVIAAETEGAQFITMRNRVNSTSGTEGYCFGDHIAIVVMGGPGQLAFSQTFTDNGNASENAGENVVERQQNISRIEVGRFDNRDGETATAHSYFKVKSDHQKLGYLLFDALT
tara:strand:- start:6748 stop:7743 length:996 start_codon:yes stop_codon:yes gene_type:complete